jgi:diphthamide synthase (EF-2-diphthine--ammonia ligase)
VHLLNVNHWYLKMKTHELWKERKQKNTHPLCKKMSVVLCKYLWQVLFSAALAISANQFGKFPVIITKGSCNCLLAFAVNFELKNSLKDMIGLWENGTKNTHPLCKKMSVVLCKYLWQVLFSTWTKQIWTV